MHDMNLAILVGRLTMEPELKTFDSGSRVVRYTVTSRVEEPKRRVDVIPVTYWVDPDEEPLLPEKGAAILVVGSIQRRYWESPDGRKSRIEIVGDDITLVEGDRAPARLIDVSARLANGGEEE